MLNLIENQLAMRPQKRFNPLISLPITLCLLFGSAALLRAQTNTDSIPFSAQLLSEYIQHESISGNERDAGLFLASVAEEMGLHVAILTSARDSFNFTASLYPLHLNKPNIVFLNHIDVVPAYNEEEFTYPPFSGTIADGRVWGRGAIDVKGVAVMQLLAIREFVELARAQDLPYNVTLLSVSGEETGGLNGAKIVADEFLELLNPTVVFGEGGLGIPNLLVSNPERKVFGISLNFKRRLWLNLNLGMTTTGHGSVTPANFVVTDKIRTLTNIIHWKRDEQFIYLTRTMFRELGHLEGGFRGHALRNLWLYRPMVVNKMRRDKLIYSLITNTVTITSISTPEGSPNQIPQKINVVLDCRLLPGVKTSHFIRQLDKIIANGNIEVDILFEDPMVESTKPERFYYLMEAALQEIYPGSAVIPILFPASNDNNYFRAHGIPVYGISPIYLGKEYLQSIHNVDERIPIDALERGTAVYVKLIGSVIGQ